MKHSMASKSSSQSSKSPKASLSSRVRQEITKRFEKPHGKKSNTAEPESERDDGTLSSIAPHSTAEPQSTVCSNFPSSSLENSATGTTVVNGMQSEASRSQDTRVDMNRPGEISLWDKACANLRKRDEHSKYVSKAIGI